MNVGRYLRGEDRHVGTARVTKLGTNMTPQKRLQQLAAAEGYQSSGPPPPTYEEMLHELWFLRSRVKQLEQQLSDSSWQTNPDRMGGSFTQSEIDNATAWK